MDIHIYIYIFLGILITIFAYTTWNILRKYEKSTDTILELEDRIIATKRRVSDSYNKMKELDRREMFETDDEVGQVFKQISDVIEELDRGV
jgi:predicted  nucleic acid-binding Zn-ribbon protein